MRIQKLIFDPLTDSTGCVRLILIQGCEDIPYKLLESDIYEWMESSVLLCHRRQHDIILQRMTKNDFVLNTNTILNNYL